MSALIIPFHPPAAPVAVRPVYPLPSHSARHGRTYEFAQVIAMLELGAADSRTQVKHLRLYAAQSGMPLPRNLRVFGGRVETGPGSIGRKSVWCAMEFDAWLARGRTPPPVADALEPGPVLAPDRRATLADRAARLAAGA